MGRWTVPGFPGRVGADMRARYVSFRCAALTFRGAPLPPAYGFPVKLRVPTKLGFKHPKHIVAIEVTNVYPGGFWEDYGYNWFSGS